MSRDVDRVPFLLANFVHREAAARARVAGLGLHARHVLAVVLELTASFSKLGDSVALGVIADRVNIEPVAGDGERRRRAIEGRRRQVSTALHQLAKAGVLTYAPGGRPGGSKFSRVDLTPCLVPPWLTDTKVTENKRVEDLLTELPDPLREISGVGADQPHRPPRSDVTTPEISRDDPLREISSNQGSYQGITKGVADEAPLGDDDPQGASRIPDEIIAKARALVRVKANEVDHQRLSELVTDGTATLDELGELIEEFHDSGRRFDFASRLIGALRESTTRSRPRPPSTTAPHALHPDSKFLPGSGWVEPVGSRGSS